MNSVVQEPNAPTPKSSSPSTSCCGVVEEMAMCYEFITLVDPETEAAAAAALKESSSPVKSISIQQANTDYLRTIKNRIQLQQQQQQQVRQTRQQLQQQQHNKTTAKEQKTGDTSGSTSELDVCMGFWTCQDPGDLSEDDDASRPDPPPVDAPSVGSSKLGGVGSVNSPIAIDDDIVDKDEEGDPPGSTTATTPRKRLNTTSKSSPYGTGGRGGEPPEMKRDVWLAHSASRRGRRSYERRDARRMEEEDDESLAVLSPEEDEPLVVLEDSGSSREYHLRQRQRREKTRTASPHHHDHYHHRYNSPVLTNRYKPYKPTPPNRESRHYDNTSAGASSRHRHRYHRSKDRSSRHQLSQQQEQQRLHHHPQHQQQGYYPQADSDTVQACVDGGLGDSDSVRTSMTNKVMIVVVRRPQYE